MIEAYDSISNSQVGNVAKLIQTFDKSRIRDITFFDLVRKNSCVLPCAMNGVYIFFSDDGKECLYVGKNSSQQFIERIPWHFAVDEDSWSNHFLKYFRNHHGCASLPEAFVEAMECQLLMILVNNTSIINKLETILRLYMSPSYNKFKYPDRKTKDIPLNSTVDHALRYI